MRVFGLKEEYICLILGNLFVNVKIFCLIFLYLKIFVFNLMFSIIFVLFINLKIFFKVGIWILWKSCLLIINFFIFESV